MLHVKLEILIDILSKLAAIKDLRLFRTFGPLFLSIVSQLICQVQKSYGVSKGSSK